MNIGDLFVNRVGTNLRSVYLFKIILQILTNVGAAEQKEPASCSRQRGIDIHKYFSDINQFVRDYNIY